MIKLNTGVQNGFIGRCRMRSQGLIIALFGLDLIYEIFE